MTQGNLLIEILLMDHCSPSSKIGASRRTPCNVSKLFLYALVLKFSGLKLIATNKVTTYFMDNILGKVIILYIVKFLGYMYYIFSLVFR